MIWRVLFMWIIVYLVKEAVTKLPALPNSSPHMHGNGMISCLHSDRGISGVCISIVRFILIQILTIVEYIRPYIASNTAKLHVEVLYASYEFIMPNDHWSHRRSHGASYSQRINQHSRKYFHDLWHTCGIVCMGVGICVSPIIITTYLFKMVFKWFDNGISSLTNENYKQNIYKITDQNIIQPMIPGISFPMKYLINLLLCTFVVVLVHEFGHTIAASMENIRIKAVGIFVNVILPGAYVSLDEESINQLSTISKLRIICGGIWYNIVFVIICVFLSMMTPYILTWTFYNRINGVMIGQIRSDSSIQVMFSRPIQRSDVIVDIDGFQITSPHDIQERLRYLYDTKYIDTGFNQGVHFISNDIYEQLFHNLNVSTELSSSSIDNTANNTNHLPRNPLVKGHGICYDFEDVPRRLVGEGYRLFNTSLDCCEKIFLPNSMNENNETYKSYYYQTNSHHSNCFMSQSYPIQRRKDTNSQRDAVQTNILTDNNGTTIDNWSDHPAPQIIEQHNYNDSYQDVRYSFRKPSDNTLYTPENITTSFKSDFPKYNLSRRLSDKEDDEKRAYLHCLYPKHEVNRTIHNYKRCQQSSDCLSLNASSGNDSNECVFPLSIMPSSISLRFTINIRRSIPRSDSFTEMKIVFDGDPLVFFNSKYISYREYVLKPYFITNDDISHRRLQIPERVYETEEPQSKEKTFEDHDRKGKQSGSNSWLIDTLIQLPQALEFNLWLLVQVKSICTNITILSVPLIL